MICASISTVLLISSNSAVSAGSSLGGELSGSGRRSQLRFKEETRKRLSVEASGFSVKGAYHSHVTDLDTAGFLNSIFGDEEIVLVDVDLDTACTAIESL